MLPFPWACLQVTGSSRGKPSDEETGSLVPAVAAPKEAFPAPQALRLMPTTDHSQPLAWTSRARTPRWPKLPGFKLWLCCRLWLCQLWDLRQVTDRVRACLRTWNMGITGPAGRVAESQSRPNALNQAALIWSAVWALGIIIMIREVAILVVWALQVQQTGTSDYSLLGPLQPLSLSFRKTSCDEWGHWELKHACQALYGKALGCGHNL